MKKNTDDTRSEAGSEAGSEAESTTSTTSTVARFMSTSGGLFNKTFDAAKKLKESTRMRSPQSAILDGKGDFFKTFELLHESIERRGKTTHILGANRNNIEEHIKKKLDNSRVFESIINDKEDPSYEFFLCLLIDKPKSGRSKEDSRAAIKIILEKIDALEGEEKENAKIEWGAFITYVTMHTIWSHQTKLLKKDYEQEIKNAFILIKQNLRIPTGFLEAEYIDDYRAKIRALMTEIDATKGKGQMPPPAIATPISNPVETTEAHPEQSFPSKTTGQPVSRDDALSSSTSKNPSPNPDEAGPSSYPMPSAPDLEGEDVFSDIGLSSLFPDPDHNLETLWIQPKNMFRVYFNEKGMMLRLLPSKHNDNTSKERHNKINLEQFNTEQQKELLRIAINNLVAHHDTKHGDLCLFFNGSFILLKKLPYKPYDNADNKVHFEYERDDEKYIIHGQHATLQYGKISDDSFSTEVITDILKTNPEFSKDILTVANDVIDSIIKTDSSIEDERSKKLVKEACFKHLLTKLSLADIDISALPHISQSSLLDKTIHKKLLGDKTHDTKSFLDAYKQADKLCDGAYAILVDAASKVKFDDDLSENLINNLPKRDTYLLFNKALDSGFNLNYLDKYSPEESVEKIVNSLQQILTEEAELQDIGLSKIILAYRLVEKTLDIDLDEEIKLKLFNQLSKAQQSIVAGVINIIQNKHEPKEEAKLIQQFAKLNFDIKKLNFQGIKDYCSDTIKTENPLFGKIVDESLKQLKLSLSSFIKHESPLVFDNKTHESFCELAELTKDGDSSKLKSLLPNLIDIQKTGSNQQKEAITTLFASLASIGFANEIEKIQQPALTLESFRGDSKEPGLATHPQSKPRDGSASKLSTSKEESKCVIS
jgi:hypothetical protein